MLKIKRKIPFEFVLENLFSLDLVVKPMFGCHAIYVGDKIMLALRERADHTNDNGVWIATSHEHHASLKKDIPSLRTIVLLNNGRGETGWRLIPFDSDHFETEVMRACELVLKRDPRIGKVPKSKKKKLIK